MRFKALCIYFSLQKETPEFLPVFIVYARNFRFRSSSTVGNKGGLPWKFLVGYILTFQTTSTTTEISILHSYLKLFLERKIDLDNTLAFR